jgi:hypothetical protein
MKNSGELTARQRRAIPFFVAAATVESGAAAAKISKAVFYEWVKVPGFKRALDAARAEQFNEGLSAVKAASTKAATRLIEALDAESVGMRLRAARLTLELGIRITELEEIERRLARLEESFAAVTGRPGATNFENPLICPSTKSES